MASRRKTQIVELNHECRFRRLRSRLLEEGGCGSHTRSSTPSVISDESLGKVTAQYLEYNFVHNNGTNTQIHVTADEMEALQRLEELALPLGLDRQAILEAWVACDKDEQLAANYLLNNLDDLRGGPSDS